LLASLNPPGLPFLPETTTLLCRLERGKPIESDGIEKSGTCHTDHKEKPDLWTGHEDAPRAFATRPAVEGNLQHVCGPFPWYFGHHGHVFFVTRRCREACCSLALFPSVSPSSSPLFHRYHLSWFTRSNLLQRNLDVPSPIVVSRDAVECPGVPSSF
jgi:hypothetical protein